MEGLEHSQPRGRTETPWERADRNFGELLGELRVALPGVQVLFAFLLTVPFNQRFGDVTPFEKDVYFGTLICTALASALLIAPSAYARIEFHAHDKENVVRVANRLVITGLAFLALAMSGAILLVTSFLFSTVEGIVFASLALALFATLWYVLPLRRRHRVLHAPEHTESTP